MPTLEEVLEVENIPVEERPIPSESPMEEPLKSIEQIAAEQGVGPINFDELRKLGEFWPEDESIDDFLAFIRESRRDVYERRID